MSNTGSDTYFSHRRPLRVIVNIITLWSFLFSAIFGSTGDIAWAARTPLELTGVSSIRAGGPGSFIKDVDVESFALPEHLGYVRQAFKGGSGRAVIHIQDAHCNYAAQHKISEIITYLTKEYGIEALNLEGGKGDYDLSIFTRIHDKKIREKVADYFVKEGLVSGAEYFAINNPDSVGLWGVEESDLYLENLNIYKESLEYKPTIEKHLKELTHIVNNLKRHIYSKELLENDIKYSQYKTGELEFREYLKYLIDKTDEKALDISRLTNIILLIQALSQEGDIDFRQADSERREIVERLKKILSENELKELLSKALEFKGERISQNAFYTYLIRKAKSINLDLGDFPELQKYVLYIAKYDTIDNFSLMGEIADLEETIKQSFYKNDIQKELNLLSKNLVLTQNLFNISLTPDDYKYYKDNEDSFTTHNFVSFINREAPLYKIRASLDENIGDLDRYREKITTFYEYSFKRDEAFLRNIRYSASQTILVTGGFHTESLAWLFKDNDISFISIMPNFKNGDGYECPYFSLLTNGRETTIDSFLTKVLGYTPAQSSLAIQSLFTRMGIDTQDGNMLDLKARVLTDILQGEAFTVSTRWGNIRIVPGEVDNADFQIQTNGITLSAVIEVGEAVPGEVIDIVLVDGDTMTWEQQEVWIDKIGKTVGAHDFGTQAGEDIDELTAALGRLGLGAEQIDFILLGENIQVWNKSIGLVEGHPGGDAIYLNPDIFVKGYDYVAIVLLHEVGGAYRVSDKQNAKLNATYKAYGDAAKVPVQIEAKRLINLAMENAPTLGRVKAGEDRDFAVTGDYADISEQLRLATSGLRLTCPETPQERLTVVFRKLMSQTDRKKTAAWKKVFSEQTSRAGLYDGRMGKSIVDDSGAFYESPFISFREALYSSSLYGKMIELVLILYSDRFVELDIDNKVYRFLFDKACTFNDLDAFIKSLSDSLRNKLNLRMPLDMNEEDFTSLISSDSGRMLLDVALNEIIDMAVRQNIVSDVGKEIEAETRVDARPVSEKWHTTLIGIQTSRADGIQIPNRSWARNNMRLVNGFWLSGLGPERGLGLVSRGIKGGLRSAFTEEGMTTFEENREHLPFLPVSTSELPYGGIAWSNASVIAYFNKEGLPIASADELGQLRKAMDMGGVPQGDVGEVVVKNILPWNNLKWLFLEKSQFEENRALLERLGLLDKTIVFGVSARGFYFYGANRDSDIKYFIAPTTFFGEESIDSVNVDLAFDIAARLAITDVAKREYLAQRVDSLSRADRILQQANSKGADVTFTPESLATELGEPLDIVIDVLAESGRYTVRATTVDNFGKRILNVRLASQGEPLMSWNDITEELSPEEQAIYVRNVAEKATAMTDFRISKTLRIPMARRERAEAEIADTKLYPFSLARPSPPTTCLPWYWDEAQGRWVLDKKAGKRMKKWLQGPPTTCLPWYWDEVTGEWVLDKGDQEKLKGPTILITSILGPMGNNDFGIAGDNQGGTDRKAHEDYHRRGMFADVISDIAREIGANVRADGRFDLRSVVENAPGRRIKTSHGEIYITEDGILVIIDSKFKKDHAGRGELAIYARTEAKAQHELTELRGWIEFTVNKGLATREAILNGEVDLGQILRNYMNGIGENLTPMQLVNRRQEIFRQRDRLHQQGLEAERGLQQRQSHPHRKFAIIVYADKSTDWNGALGNLVELRNELESRGYTVRNTRVDSVDSLIESIGLYTTEQAADLLIIGAHGTQQSMHLGNGLDGQLTIQNINRLDRMQDRLAEGSAVILQSCSTARGEGFEGNMANAFAEIFPQAEHVFAPRVPAGPRFIFDANNQVAGIKYDNNEGAGVITRINLRTHDTNLTESGYDAVVGRRIAKNIVETIDEADMDFIISSEGFLPISSSEQRFEDNQAIVRRDVNALIEQGLDKIDEAVAVHGTGIEAIVHLIQHGTLPREGRHPDEFFFYPLTLGKNKALDEAKAYAEWNALKYYVLDKLSFSLDNDTLEELSSYVMGIMDFEECLQLGRLCRERGVTERDLVRWISEAQGQKREGVLVLLSPQLFDEFSPIIDEEEGKVDMGELGLSTKYILGIEPLGQHEWDVINALQARTSSVASRSESKDADFGIASDNQVGLGRLAHEGFHRIGRFTEVIGDIAIQINASARNDGRFDLRTIVENAIGKKIKTSHGEIYLTDDGILVIIDSRFEKDHAGRNEFAVYARNKTKAQHELSELRDWKDFALSNEAKILKLHVTKNDIAEGRLGKKLREWMNSDNISQGERDSRWVEIQKLRDEFHAKAIEAEFKFVIGNDIDAGLAQVRADDEKIPEPEYTSTREELERFVSRLDIAQAELLGGAPGAGGTMLYRIVGQSNYGVLIGVNLWNEKISMLAVLDDVFDVAKHDFALRDDVEIRYKIVGKKLTDEFAPAIMKFLKAREDQLPDHYSEYAHRIFFSAINPFLTKERLFQAYAQNPALRYILSQIGPGRLKHNIVNKVLLVSKDLWRLRNGGEVGGHALQSEVGIELGELWRLVDNMRWGKEKPGEFDYITLHELGHIAARNVIQHLIDTGTDTVDARTRINGIADGIRKDNTYKDMSTGALLEEAIVRIISALAYGETILKLEDGRTLAIDEDLVKELAHLGIIDAPYTVQQAIEVVSPMAEQQTELDFIISSEGYDVAKTSPLTEQMAASDGITADVRQGTTDVVVMPRSELYKAPEFSEARQRAKELNRADKYTIPLLYHNDANWQENLEPVLESALQELQKKTAEGDTIARALVYVPQGGRDFVEGVLDTLPYRGYFNRFSIVEVKYNPAQGVIDKYAHIDLAKGLLNYERFEQGDYGDARLDREAKLRLVGYIKILNPDSEVIDFEKDPDVILRELLTGIAILEPTPINFEDIRDRMREREQIRRAA